MIDLLKQHASVRDYTEEQISDETFHEMLHAAQYAASSNFVQAYSVIQVKDDYKRRKLGKLSRNERQFATAALSLIFCADLRRAETAVQQQNVQIKGDTLENFVVSVIDTSLFAQNFVVAAESKGYGICYIGGVRNNPKEISELFHLPQHVIPLFGMTVGVPAAKNEIKPRMPHEMIIHVDEYNENKYLKQLNDYDEIYRNYYRARSTNKKDISWSDTMKPFLSNKRREELMAFYQSKGFLLDDK